MVFWVMIPGKSYVTHYNSRYWQATAPCGTARAGPNVLPSNFAVYMSRMRALPAPVAWLKSGGVLGKSRNILTPSSVCAIGIHRIRSLMLDLLASKLVPVSNWGMSC